MDAYYGPVSRLEAALSRAGAGLRSFGDESEEDDEEGEGEGNGFDDDDDDDGGGLQVAQPARDAPLVGMEEKIPILYYNTIDSDIREGFGGGDERQERRHFSLKPINNNHAPPPSSSHLER